jgi:hypothetical protein
MSVEPELERICREIVDEGGAVFRWEWDGRYGVALTALGKDREAEILALLRARLPLGWTRETIGDAPMHVRDLAASMGGLRLGQMLMCAEVSGSLLFCAWWPWQNGKIVSIRVGIRAVDTGAPGDHDETLRAWFGCS